MPRCAQAFSESAAVHQSHAKRLDAQSKRPGSLRCISDPLRRALSLGVCHPSRSLESCAALGPDRPQNPCCWPRRSPHQQATELQRHLQRQGFRKFAVVACDHGVPLQVYRAPRFRAGQLLSVARASWPCLHRSPEFFAVPLAVPGLSSGGGRVCKAQLYGFPPQELKAPLARSWLSVGRRGEEIRGTVLGAASHGQWTPRGERL